MPSRVNSRKAIPARAARESFLEGASKLDDIWFWDLKEENIAILGAEKPDENRG